MENEFCEEEEKWTSNTYIIEKKYLTKSNTLFSDWLILITYGCSSAQMKLSL